MAKSASEPSKVLVTGASGFIGGHVCRYLGARDFQVHGAVRSRPHGIADATTVVTGDLATIGTWARRLREVDVVVHAAGLAHHDRPPSAAYRERLQQANVLATANIAEAAAEAGVRLLVFISSIAAVRSSSAGPLQEEVQPRPETPYGESKREAELTLKAALDSTSTAWCIIRPPLVYGPGNPGNMDRLTRLVRSGLPLPFGSIENQRSFCYVFNLADSVAACASRPEARNRVYHVADDRPMSTPELTALIASLTGSRNRMVRVPPRVLGGFGHIGDVLGRVLPFPVSTDSVARLTSSLVLDTSRIKRELEWEPPFSTHEGLAESVSAGSAKTAT